MTRKQQSRLDEIRAEIAASTRLRVDSVSDCLDDGRPARTVLVWIKGNHWMDPRICYKIGRRGGLVRTEYRIDGKTVSRPAYVTEGRE